MKNKEIESLKQKMEDMVVEFEHMLKETLAKMGNTISDAQSRDDGTVSEALLNDEKLREFVGSNLLTDNLGNLRSSSTSEISEK
jgi:hypothetical protein